MAAPQPPETGGTYDPDHHSIAHLLMARGELLAAGLVALSRYRTDCVDNWNGGQYRATLEVPAEAFDQVCGELRKCLDAACRDVIGSDSYSGLQICVLAPPEDPDWAVALIGVLELRRIPSQRIDVPILDVVSTSS